MMIPDRCEQARTHFVDVLDGNADTVDIGPARVHVARCQSCRAELAALRTVMSDLPGGPDPEPPADIRVAVLAYARDNGREPDAVRSLLWHLVTPALVSAVVAGLVVTLNYLRGALAGIEGTTIAAVSLAATLGAEGTFLQRTRSREYRLLLLGSLGGLAGYMLMTLATPVPATVDVCGSAVFGAAPLSPRQVAGLYFAVTAFYSAVPMVLAGYLSRLDVRGLATQARGAFSFALVAIPALLLQTGAETLLAPMAGAAGLVVGAGLGLRSGTAARRWILEGA